MASRVHHPTRHAREFGGSRHRLLELRHVQNSLSSHITLPHIVIQVNWFLIPKELLTNRLAIAAHHFLKPQV